MGLTPNLELCNYYNTFLSFCLSNRHIYLYLGIKIYKSLKSSQIVKKYKDKNKRDQKTASKSTASSLLETGGKEYFAFMPMKKGLTLLYQTYEFNMERPTGIEPASSPWEGEVLPLNNGRRTEGLFSLPLVSTTYYPD